MDLSTVSSAVNDALAGLPSGTSDFIKANIGTPTGQQAILKAGLSLGLTQAQIASAVSQATGMTVTPQQVAQVAQSVAPAPAPASQFVGSAAPGAVGTSYGQANLNQIASAQQASPDVATALQNGTAKLNYDASSGSYNLIDSKSGSPISGNYQVQVGNNGQIGINVPTANGSMVQVATKVGDNGQIAPITSSDVLNAGVNKGAGGFAGGVSNLLSLAAPVAGIINPALIPYIAAYNSADAASKGKYGAALLSAGVSYAGFNPDSQLAQLVKSGQNVPTDASGAPTVDASTPANTGTPISQVGAPSTTTGTYLGPNGELVPIPNYNPTNPIDTTGLNQNFGTNAITANNLSGMNTAYTNAMANGGFTSGYQTLPDGSKVMIQNDGTAIQTNPVTGATTALNTTQVQDLVSKGQLNSSSSGYNSATGGTTTAPGGGTINNNGTTTLPDGSIVKTPVNTPASTSLLTPTNVLGASAVLNTLGTLGTNKAIANASNTQTAAANDVKGVLGDFYNSYKQSQQPYQQTGVQATNALGALGSGTYNIMNPDGSIKTTGTGNDYLTHQFNAQDLQAGLAPNYDFMLQQGQGANRNLANAGGGLLSGNTLQGLNQFTQNYAQNAYQNAFNNYQTQRQNIYSNLSNAAGLGQTSLGQLGQVGSNLAQTYGNVTTGLAATQAGAQTAQAVNTQNALSNLGNTALVASLIKPA